MNALYEDQEETILKNKKRKSNHNIREMSKSECTVCKGIHLLLTENKQFNWTEYEHNCEDYRCSQDEVSAELPNRFGEPQSLENNYDINFEL